jgi:hypothetical protein
MMTIPVQAISNQELLVVLDNNQWTITVKSTNGSISVSLSINGTSIADSVRAVAGGFIIQSEYQEAGNFAFLCQDFTIPDYTQFGITQFLTYFSQAELDALRVAEKPPFTVADFNPIAGLPLRFAPQGYTLAS